MKRRILSFILALIILPTVFLFSGCDKGYNLSTFKEDYEKCFENHQTIKYENNEIVFNYSDFPYLKQHIDSNATSYYYLNYYNTMLNNACEFVNTYANELSTNKYEVSKETRNNLKNNIEDFSVSLNKIETALLGLADQVETLKSEQSAISLYKLQILYDSYSEAFDVAYNLNNCAMEIYFSTTGIENYTNGTIEPLNALIKTKFQARLKQQIVNTTRIFVEKNVCNSTISDKLAHTTYYMSFISKFNNYNNSIFKLDKTYTEANIEAVSNNAMKLESFKENMIKFNNVQAVLNNEIDFFNSAINDINYIKSSLDSNASANEKFDIVHINNFEILNNEYNSALINILSALGV